MDWSKVTPELEKPLNPAHIASRKQGGVSVDYIEGWHAIAEANRIFGFDAWTREVVECRCVTERERLIGQQQKPGWTVTYIARVRVTVAGLTREGSGAGHGISTDLGECHESAIKEAETDAMKRALMTFGNPFGLALYDKSRGNVAVPVITAAQASIIRALLSEVGADEGRFLNFAGADSIEQIASAKFEFLHQTLLRKRNQTPAAAE